MWLDAAVIRSCQWHSLVFLQEGKGSGRSTQNIEKGRTIRLKEPGILISLNPTSLSEPAYLRICVVSLASVFESFFAMYCNTLGETAILEPPWMYLVTGWIGNPMFW